MPSLWYRLIPKVKILNNKTVLASFLNDTVDIKIYYILVSEYGIYYN